MAAKAKRAAPKSAAAAKITSPKAIHPDATKVEEEKPKRGSKAVAITKATTNGKVSGKSAAKEVASPKAPTTSVATKSAKLPAVSTVADNKDKGIRAASSRSAKDKVTVQPADSTVDQTEATPPKKTFGDNPTKVRKGTGGMQATDKNRNNIENGLQPKDVEMEAKSKKSKEAVANGTKKVAQSKVSKVAVEEDMNTESSDLDENFEESAASPATKKTNNAKSVKMGSKATNLPRSSTSDEASKSTDKKGVKRKAEVSKKSDASKKSVKEPATKKQKVSIPLAG